MFLLTGRRSWFLWAEPVEPTHQTHFPRELMHHAHTSIGRRANPVRHLVVNAAAPELRTTTRTRLLSALRCFVPPLDVALVSPEPLS